MQYYANETIFQRLLLNVWLIATAIDYDSKNAKCINGTCIYDLCMELERCQNSQGVVLNVQDCANNYTNVYHTDLCKVFIT